MATGPVDAAAGATDDVAHHVLARRLEESEQNVARLTAELEEARARIAQLEAIPADDPAGLSLFEGGEAAPRLTGDGSDPRILSIALGATALVAGMVTVLALLNGTLITPFGLVILVLTVVLAWAAMRTRVEPTEVSVVRGMVYVKKGDSTHRFDVRNPATPVNQVGTPGESGWRLEIGRRGLEPFVINGSMVDAVSFVSQLREWRPEL